MRKPLRHPWLRVVLTALVGGGLVMCLVLWVFSYPSVLRALPDRREDIDEWALAHHVQIKSVTTPLGPALTVAPGFADGSYGTWAVYLNRGQFSCHGFRATTRYWPSVWCLQDAGWLVGVEDSRGPSVQGPGAETHLGPDYVPPTLGNLLGFRLTWGPASSFDPGATVPAGAGTQVGVHVPLWFPTVVLAALTAYLIRTLVLHRRLRRRVAEGMCPECGYDLRAHRGDAGLPARCPECATPFPAAGGAPTISA